MSSTRASRRTRSARLAIAAPFIRNATERRLLRAASIGDLRAIARRRTPRAVFDYTDGAADGELSLNRAKAAIDNGGFADEIAIVRSISSDTRPAATAATAARRRPRRR